MKSIIMKAILAFTLLSFIQMSWTREDTQFLREPRSVEGFEYTADLIFEALLTSKVECGVLCSSEVSCVSFTFTPFTSLRPARCRGHSSVVTTAGAFGHKIPSIGTKVYKRKGKASP